ncbi:PREDICTED: defensin-like protein 289 [Camelina sativa]|uniref:Defensin-like protein 289 n=1 Tax=Camelina sativa TaxID=90675 RepID=A0ABM0X1A5_CAMSA|nr:PREDICTED: defensin-like protein 289 [Camelina sativa]
MAASRTTMIIIFVLCLSCTLLVNIFGVQTNDASCKTTKECVVRCSDEDAKCISHGECHCPLLKVNIFGVHFNDASCLTTNECVVRCSDENAKCIRTHGECQCPL